MPRTNPVATARWRDGASLALALLALTACGGPAPGDPAPHTPTPSPSATPTPTATGTAATPTASPPPSATPTRSPQTAAPRYCGDEFILDRPHLVWWEGTEAEQLAAADAQPVFEPADALDGLDVICASTFTTPIDDPSGGTLRISEALVDRDEEAFARLEAWAAANGYEPVDDGPGYVQHEAPADPDGSRRSFFWAPLDSTQPMLGNAETIVRHTGADPDDILVWHGVGRQP